MSRNKKDDNPLGLPVLTSPPKVTAENTLTSFYANRSLSFGERWTIDELHRETTVIDAQWVKTVFGQDKIGQIDQHAIGVFAEVLDSTAALLSEPRGEEDQRLLYKFAFQMTQLAGQDLFSAAQVGNRNIGMEIARPLYPPAEPPPPPRRLFGLLPPSPPSGR